MKIHSLSALSSPLYMPSSSIEGADLTGLRSVKKRLRLCHSQLNLLERWQFLHYKKNGFLGWVARFILNLWSPSQVRFKQIETLLLAEEMAKSATCALLKKERKAPSTALPKDSGMKRADKLLNLRKRALALLKSQPYLSLLNIAPQLLGDKKFVLALVERNVVHLNLAAPELKADKEFMLAAVQQDGRALEFAAAHLQADKEVVLASVQKCGVALKYTALELKADKQIVMAAVEQNMWALEYASADLKADKSFMLDVVKLYGGAIYWAAADLQADKEVAMAAVQKNGLALLYTALKLRADKDIVLAAIKQDRSALMWVADALRADKEVIASSSAEKS